MTPLIVIQYRDHQRLGKGS